MTDQGNRRRHGVHGTLLFTAAVVVTILLTSCSQGQLTSVLSSALQVPRPLFSHEEGTYFEDILVEISNDLEGVTIRYTLNGDDPQFDSPEYEGPIEIAGDGTEVTLKAYASKQDMQASPIARAEFEIEYEQVAEPAFSQPAGTYSNDFTVSLSCDTEGATIHYTTDGTVPQEDSPTFDAASPIAVAGDGTELYIKAFAAIEGMESSDLVEKRYAIDYDQVSPPEFSVAPGTYAADFEVTLSCDTEGACIYYTTDGTVPTTDSSQFDSALPISVAGDGTELYVKAFATLDHMKSSDLVENRYAIDYDQVAAPELTPAPGIFHEDLSVSLSCSTPGVTIHYTTDGTIPTTASPVFDPADPIAVAGDAALVYVKAIAVKDGMAASDIAEGRYDIDYYTVESPVLDPPAGFYNYDVTVTISCGTSGADIHYTTDGTVPTAASPVYDGGTPIEIAGSGADVFVKAIGVKSGMTDSDLAEGRYTIDYDAVAPPQFSPSAGTYNQADGLTTITLTSDTPGATIYWDLGQPPYEDSPDVPTGTDYSVTPPTIGADGEYLFFAYAVKAGLDPSPLSFATYSIDTTPPSPPSIDGVTAGLYNSSRLFTLGGIESGATAEYSLDGGSTWSPYSDPVELTDDGSYSISSQQIDAAGNPSGPSGNVVVEIDKIVPDAPSTPNLAAADDSGASNTDNNTRNTNNLTFSGTAEADATITLSSDTDGTVGTTTANGSGTWSVDVALSATTHQITATATDQAGNVSATASPALSVTVDTTGPNPPSVSAPSSPTMDTTPSWSWTSGGNGGSGAYRYELDNSDLTSGATETTSTGYTPGSPISEGGHTLYVQEQDVAGNWSNSGSAAVTIEITAPSNPSPAHNNVSDGVSPSLNWEDIPDADAYAIQVDDNWDVSSPFVDTTTTSSQYQIATVLSHGSGYYWRVRTRNADGVWGAWSSIWHFTAEYTIGDRGPADGWIFYDDEDDGTNDYPFRYLILAPVTTEWTSKPWGGSSVAVGSTSAALGTGASNTADIVSAYGTAEPYESRTDYAARLCDNLTHGGYSDWYLPSQQELALVRSNLYLQGDGGFGDPPIYYWSSTENDANSSMCHDFLNGNWNTYSKWVEVTVRAVRSW